MKKENMIKNSNTDNSKKNGTFIVKVEKCQNETWQGQVIWADENKSQYFRSAMELIKMMDNALQKRQMIENIDRKVSV